MSMNVTPEQLEILANAFEILGSATHYTTSSLEDLSVILELEVSSADQKRMMADPDILDFLGIYPEEGDVIPEGLHITRMAVKMPLFWDTPGVVLRSGSFYRLTRQDEVGIATSNGGYIEYSAAALGLDGSQLKTRRIHLGEDLRDFLESDEVS